MASAREPSEVRGTLSKMDVCEEWELLILVIFDVEKALNCKLAEQSLL